MNPVVDPTPVVSLDWTNVIGPVLFASALTLIGTVALHFLSAWRENRHRFTADRRAAYVELITLAGHYSYGHDEVLRMGAQVAELEQRQRDNPLDPTVRVRLESARRALDRLLDRFTDDGLRLLAATSTVMLLAPEAVMDKAAALIAVPLEKVKSPRGGDAINELVAAMRADLRIKG